MKTVRPPLSTVGESILDGTYEDPYDGIPSVGELAVDGHTPPPGDVDSGASWRPVDLGPILRGERVRASPSIGLARSDRLRLLYPGKEHSVIGEMESGKSWFADACAAAEINDANPVVYVHFEESDPLDTVDRLRLLGVADDALAELFRFVGPEEPVRAEWLAQLLALAPSLVVLDGVNEALALHQFGINDAEGAAAFRRRLVKPFTAVGAAVLSCDHVVKDKEGRGRYALGSVHKGNGLSGALILLENAEPFGRGERGRSHVFITKDRPGALRSCGKPTKAPGKTFMGELVVDDTRTEHDWLTLDLWAPGQHTDDEPAEPATDPHAEADAAILDVVRAILATGDTANTRAVRARSPFGNAKTADALTRLTLHGALTETTGSRGAHLYHLPTTPTTGPATGSGSGPKGPGTGEPVDQPVPTGPETTRNQSEPLEKPA